MAGLGTVRVEVAPRFTTHADVGHRTAFHPAATPDRAAQHEQVRAAVAVLGHTLVDLLPQPMAESEEAFRALDSVMMWANAAVARQVEADVAGAGDSPTE